VSHVPEPWQTNVARPFVVIEKPRGTVSISGLGNERFRVEAPGHDSEVEGHEKAKPLAHELAAGLELDTAPARWTAALTWPRRCRGSQR